MKSLFYTFLIIVLIQAFTGCKTDDDSPARVLIPAKFVKPFNETKVKRGAEVSIEAEIAALEEIKELKIFTRDTVFFQGTPTKENLSFVLNTYNLRLGGLQVSMEYVMQDGKVKKDNRIIRLLSDIYPTDFRAEVVNVFPHSTSSYTQGLEFDNGILYEGTGGMGRMGSISKVLKTNWKTGEILLEHVLVEQYFGEGITIIGDKLYQLTWQQNKCFVYDKNTLELINELSYSGEGWGLCNDGKHLIMSDGTERLYFRDPETFQLVKTIEVYSNTGPVTRLNELEYIDGKVLANVYTTNDIVKINLETGAVEAIIDLSIIALEHKKGGEVLNGIAYKRDEKRLFVTGKNWPSLLEIELVKI